MKFFKLLLVFTVVLVALVGGVYTWGFYAPESKLGEAVSFRIERGESLMKIASRLESDGLIPNAKLFYYYMRATKQGGSVKAGLFEIPAKAGVVRAADLLQRPIPEGTLVQITEGLTIWQCASSIAKVLPIDSTKFIEHCTDTSFITSLGFPGDTSLEGYLFPETYNIPKGANERDIITLMVSQFKRIYDSLPKVGEGASMARHELVTLASIVEKEAQVAHERARISAVFHNRLKRGIPLGADPTVRYAIRKFSGPLRVSELKNPSPYNTRIHKGLIPGPICSPGKAALEATISPLETDELFFVAKWDGSGEHYFSVTNAEHNRRKMQVRSENKELSNW